MHIVWRQGPVTVRDVYEDLLRRRKVAYTTVMTMMGILEQKGYVTRKAGEKAHVYSQALSERKVVGSTVKDLLNRLFDGSARSLLVHLIENRQLKPRELEEITGIIREADTRKGRKS